MEGKAHYSTVQATCWSQHLEVFRE